MTLVHHDIRPSHIVTKQSLENAIASVSATGGSTNAALHMPADRGRLRHPADPRRLRGRHRSNPADRRHAPRRPVRRLGHVRGGRRGPRDARAAQARPAPRRAEDRGRAHDREDRRRRRRDAGPARRPPDRDPDQGDGRPRDPARQPGARRVHREARRPRAPLPPRPGPRVRLRERVLRCREGPPDPRGRRGRDPVRGPGRRPRDAGDALGHGRARRRGAGRARRTAHGRPLLAAARTA